MTPSAGQCTTARKLTGLDMDRLGSHVSNRYEPAITGSDGIFADHRNQSDQVDGAKVYFFGHTPGNSQDSI